MTTPRRKVVLYGNRRMATFAQAVLTHDSPYEVVAFTVDDALITETTILGLPVVPFEEVERLTRRRTTLRISPLGFGA